MRQVAFHRPAIGAEEEREVLEALRSGWITTGPRARRFEQDFAAYVGARRALAVAHCTGALHLALFALDVGPNDEVLTTPFTFTATAEVVGYLGARPVFVDVEEDTFNIDPECIEQALSSGRLQRARAMLPVHFAGQPCEMDRLLEIAQRFGMRVVEDAAHAIGAAVEMEGRGMTRVGTIADITCFSFYATKNITSAEGGMVTTEDEQIANRMAVASLHGMDRDAWKRYDASGSWYYEIHDMGFKYNLSDVHAAIGMVQLRRADEFMRRRSEIAERYSAAFSSEEALIVPHTRPGRKHAWHLYVLQIRPEMLSVERNRLVEILRERGVGVSVHCIPLHTMHFYQRRYGYKNGDFPVSERIFSRCFSLPIYPAMTVEDQDYVIDTVLAAVRENRR